MSTQKSLKLQFRRDLSFIFSESTDPLKPTPASQIFNQLHRHLVKQKDAASFQTSQDSAADSAHFPFKIVLLVHSEEQRCQKCKCVAVFFFNIETSLTAQWMMTTSSSSARGMGLIPGRGAKLPHASRPKNQNIKQKQHCNKFNKELKNSPHQKTLKINYRSFVHVCCMSSKNDLSMSQVPSLLLISLFSRII